MTTDHAGLEIARHAMHALQCERAMDECVKRGLATRRSLPSGNPEYPLTPLGEEVCRSWWTTPAGQRLALQGQIIALMEEIRK